MEAGLGVPRGIDRTRGSTAARGDTSGGAAGSHPQPAGALLPPATCAMVSALAQPPCSHTYVWAAQSAASCARALFGSWICGTRGAARGGRVSRGRGEGDSRGQGVRTQRGRTARQAARLPLPMPLAPLARSTTLAMMIPCISAHTVSLGACRRCFWRPEMSMISCRADRGRRGGGGIGGGMWGR